jgi:hypothetical protein
VCFAFAGKKGVEKKKKKVRSLRVTFAQFAGKKV